MGESIPGCKIEDSMIVYVSVDEKRPVVSSTFPTIYVTSDRPENLASGDYYISSNETGRGARLKRAFAYAFEVLEADGVITLPDGEYGEAHEMRARQIAAALQEGADLVDGSIECSSPFLLGGIFRLVTSFTMGSRRLPWCGMRGYSKKMAALLASVKAKGAEYDTVLLQAAVTDGVKITDLSGDLPPVSPARTARSLRNTVCGAWGIFMNSTSLKFLFSSGVAFLIDYFLLLLLAPCMPFGSQQWNAVVAQAIVWVLSSQTNFHLNRLLVFGASNRLWTAMAQYYSLAVFVLLGKSVLLGVLTFLPLWIAKLLCEVSFFLFNYIVQKKLIFKRKK